MLGVVDRVGPGLLLTFESRTTGLGRSVVESKLTSQGRTVSEVLVSSQIEGPGVLVLGALPIDLYLDGVPVRAVAPRYRSIEEGVSLVPIGQGSHVLEFIEPYSYSHTTVALPLEKIAYQAGRVIALARGAGTDVDLRPLQETYEPGQQVEARVVSASLSGGSVECFGLPPGSQSSQSAASWTVSDHRVVTAGVFQSILHHGNSIEIATKSVVAQGQDGVALEFELGYLNPALARMRSDRDLRFEYEVRNQRLGIQADPYSGVQLFDPISNRAG